MCSLIWENRPPPSIYKLPSSRPSTPKSFNIPPTLPPLTECATPNRGIFLICRSRSLSHCDCWSWWTLQIFTYWNPDPFHTSSDHEMYHDWRSIFSFISALWFFPPLAYFTIWKSFCSRACPLCGTLQCRWSILRLISTFHYGSHLTHFVNLTTVFFLASLTHKMPFHHWSLYL